jgi:hypothetical protein
MIIETLSDGFGSLFTWVGELNATLVVYTTGFWDYLHLFPLLIPNLQLCLSLGDMLDSDDLRW